MAKLQDDGVGEEGVEPHARRESNRQVGEKAHDEAADGGSETGGDEDSAVIHAGFGEDVGVDEDDVGHRQKGGNAGDGFGAGGSAVCFELEEFVEHGGSGCVFGDAARGRVVIPFGGGATRGGYFIAAARAGWGFRERCRNGRGGRRHWCVRGAGNGR